MGADPDMGWYQVTEEKLRYRGRITRAPFDAWAASPAGDEAIAAAAKLIGFRLFGRARAARRNMWRAVKTISTSPAGIAALDAAADAYGRALSDLAYAQGLPRTQVGLRRLVLVPRALAAGRARAAVAGRLRQCPLIEELSEPLRAFLFERVVFELDAAARQARPSVKRPIRAHDWTCIGVDTEFGWVDQVWSGAGWSGHFFVYEWPPSPLTRADRKAVDKAMSDLQSGVNTLSRERRQQLVNVAARA
jgi:hypothetical protein